ncbi:hypothetical protein VCUG_00166 [Vavraia culicis subsp. floridensis]|uniref:Uncharacterized protein n=1 Tax=Vavraia culicis (isolate floridensis) TaxID=948595 RepID=L2GZ04_VAVCU|nr:uncharacterized protein VCUG_00166 [Vavraia culicis subsp. floridensis]ELA48330.1 hypothetical protein VCUG_00166 [Vavraia culicis subsp. floridensis]
MNKYLQRSHMRYIEHVLFFSFLLNKSTKPMNRICIDSMAHRFKQIACCFNYQLNSLFNQCSALNACMNSIKKHLMLFICIKCFLQSGCYKRSICEQDAKCYAYAENMSRTRTKHSTQSLFVSVIPQLVCLLNRPV